MTIWEAPVCEHLGRYAFKAEHQKQYRGRGKPCNCHRSRRNDLNKALLHGANIMKNDIANSTN